MQLYISNNIYNPQLAKNTTKRVFIAASLCVPLGLGCFGRTDVVQGERESLQGTKQAPSVVLPDVAGSQMAYGVGDPAAFGGMFIASPTSAVEMTQSIAYGEQWDDENPNKVALQEVFSVVGDSMHPDTYCYEFGTSFEVFGYAPLEKNKFYVLGTSSAGETVIQKWVISGGLGGGSTPGGPRLAARSEKYRGTSISLVRDFGAEPEDRFLFFLEGSPVALARHDLTTGIITYPYSSSTVPELDDCYALFGMHHQSEGRVWIAESPNLGTIILFKDADADGAFESYVVHDYASYEAAGYIEDVWTDNFVDE